MNKRQRKKFLKKYMLKLGYKLYIDQLILGTSLYKEVNYFPYMIYINPLKWKDLKYE